MWNEVKEVAKDECERAFKDFFKKKQKKSNGMLEQTMEIAKKRSKSPEKQ